MNHLSQFIDSRDNHLNAIRIAAAVSVLVSHSFAIATGDASIEPFRHALGVTPGTLAVDIFFVTSGLLLTNSLSKKQDTLDFIASRLARIYPALIVATLITVFLLGPAFTTLPLEAYFKSSETLTYLWKTPTLVRGVGYTLPGVFHDVPLWDQVNGSLWTLPIEIRMYGLLFGIWATLRLLGLSSNSQVFRLSVVALAVGAGVLHAYKFFLQGPDAASHGLSRFIFFFFSGATLSAFQSRIVIAPSLLAASLLTIAISALSQAAFFVAWHLLGAYVIVLLAYQDAPLIGQYRKFGDYSYGVYIYAFPIQQAIAALSPGISIVGLTTTSLIATLMIATLSWHLVESPSMRFKSRLLKRLSQRSTRPLVETIPLPGSARE